MDNLIQVSSGPAMIEPCAYRLRHKRYSLRTCPWLLTSVGSHFDDVLLSLMFRKFYVLPTECIYVFCVDLRTNSDYFPIQHYSLGTVRPVC